MRVDPAGGGTDAPPFSIEYGGAVGSKGHWSGHAQAGGSLRERILKTEGASSAGGTRLEEFDEKDFQDD